MTAVDPRRQLAVHNSTNRLNEDVIRYNEVAKQVAVDQSAAINDLYQVVVDHGVEKMLGEDGIHFTDEASVILGKAVAQAIRAAGASR